MLDKTLIPSGSSFWCGPLSCIPPEYLQALAETGCDLMGTGHRKHAIKNLIKSIQEGLACYFGLPKSYQGCSGKWWCHPSL